MSNTASPPKVVRTEYGGVIVDGVRVRADGQRRDWLTGAARVREQVVAAISDQDWERIAASVVTPAAMWGPLDEGLRFYLDDAADDRDLFPGDWRADVLDEAFEAVRDVFLTAIAARARRLIANMPADWTAS